VPGYARAPRRTILSAQRFLAHFNRLSPERLATHLRSGRTCEALRNIAESPAGQGDKALRWAHSGRIQRPRPRLSRSYFTPCSERGLRAPRHQQRSVARGGLAVFAIAVMAAGRADSFGRTLLLIAPLHSWSAGRCTQTYIGAHRNVARHARFVDDELQNR